MSAWSSAQSSGSCPEKVFDEMSIDTRLVKLAKTPLSVPANVLLAKLIEVKASNTLSCGTNVPTNEADGRDRATTLLGMPELAEQVRPCHTPPAQSEHKHGYVVEFQPGENEKLHAVACVMRAACSTSAIVCATAQLFRSSGQHSNVIHGAMWCCSWPDNFRKKHGNITEACPNSSNMGLARATVQVLGGD